jgi:hypothetical protein
MLGFFLRQIYCSGWMAKPMLDFIPSTAGPANVDAGADSNRPQSPVFIALHL